MRMFVADTSVIVDGRLTQFLAGIDEDVKVIIPEAVVAEIEHQANEGKAIGHVGLEELKKLREMANEGRIILEFHGERPELWQIRRAKSGEIDNMVREIARELGATLITGDGVQRDIAIAKGIDVIYLTARKEVKHRLEDFFDETTMSVHLKAGLRPLAKKGRPGEWRLVPVRDEILTDEELEEIADDIVERAKRDPESFIELDEPGATVVQLRNYRIVIAKPPFADRIEITAVRPVKKLSIEDYGLSEKLMERLREKAEGILIAGAPGEGKTTFAQALAEWYAGMGRIVKTMEKPRDLQVGEEITQYTALSGRMEKTGDILLLVRPDYTIFDEMRKTSDFKIYADLRLAGVGMVGVVHATSPIDAIQRFIGKIELGMIPSIIDTVIFMHEGNVTRVLALKTTVKIPHGLQSEDLARPVVIVYDFLSNKPMYEIYTFGERTFVVPISREAAAELYGPEEGDSERERGRLIDTSVPSIPYVVKMGRKNIIFDFGHKMAGKTISAYIGNRFLFTDTVSKSGKVKVAKRGKLWRTLKSTFEKGDKITFLEEE